MSKLVIASIGPASSVQDGGRPGAQRYGLVHIDYETLARTRKNSFHWYADLLAAQPQHL